MLATLLTLALATLITLHVWPVSGPHMKPKKKQNQRNPDFAHKTCKIQKRKREVRIVGVEPKQSQPVKTTSITTRKTRSENDNNNENKTQQPEEKLTSRLGLP